MRPLYAVTNYENNTDLTVGYGLVELIDSNGDLVHPIDPAYDTYHNHFSYDNHFSYGFGLQVDGLEIRPVIGLSTNRTVWVIIRDKIEQVRMVIYTGNPVVSNDNMRTMWNKVHNWVDGNHHRLLNMSQEMRDCMDNRDWIIGLPIPVIQATEDVSQVLRNTLSIITDQQWYVIRQSNNAIWIRRDNRTFKLQRYKPQQTVIEVLEPYDTVWYTAEDALSLDDAQYITDMLQIDRTTVYYDHREYTVIGKNILFCPNRIPILRSTVIDAVSRLAVNTLRYNEVNTNVIEAVREYVATSNESCLPSNLRHDIQRLLEQRQHLRSVFGHIDYQTADRLLHLHNRMLPVVEVTV